MQVKTLLVGIVAFAAGTIIVGPAMARPATGDFRSKVSASGNWSDDTAWEKYNGSSWVAPSGPTDLPTLATFVTIQNGAPMAVDTTSAVADHLQVDDTLTISPAQLLTLDGSSVSTSTITSGEMIVIGDATNGAATLRFIDNNQTLAGGGSVVGAHPSSHIEINKGVRFQDTITLTNNSVVEGMMTVLPSGTGNGKAAFINARADTSSPATTGLVIANAAGTLKFDANLILADAEFVQSSIHYLPEWRAQSNGSAMLEFDRACDGSSASFPRLFGNFLVNNCAIFKCLDQVETYGGFTLTAGTIDVNAGAGKQFIYNYGVGQTVISVDNTVNCP